MDHAKYQAAQQAYDAGDFRTAAKAFLEVARESPSGNGAAFHKAGNSLMRLRRYSDAVTVYRLALRDDSYSKRGAARVNLGQALSAQGDYNDAIGEYELALQEPDNNTPWKAWQGMAAALLERGKVDEAAVAYRKAAIEPGNPNPAKSLVNLGLCFMALGRPSDAAEAYKAALGFDEYSGRGKALGNLGIAYAQMGQYDDAIRAFEKATQMHGYELSAAAQQAYESALAMKRSANPIVDGWETGDIVSGAQDGFVPVGDGWATGDLAALGGTEDVPAYSSSKSAEAADELGFGNEAAVNDFFGMTEEEMRKRDREARRGRRGGRRRVGAGAIVIALVLAAAGIAVGVLYWMGYGFPTQASTAKGLLGAYKTGADVKRYWVAAPAKDVHKEMAKIPPVKSFSVGVIDMGTNDSAARVTVVPENGAALHFKVTLAREGVGWKVTGVDNDFLSTGD